MEGSTYRQPESRALTEAELDLLRWLLTEGAEITGVDKARARSILPQLGSLRVVGHCSCGCPTIDLSLEEPSLSVDAVTGTLADVDGFSPDWTEIGIILPAVDGRIKELEVYPRGGCLPFSLPTQEHMEGFYWYRSSNSLSHVSYR